MLIRETLWSQIDRLPLSEHAKEKIASLNPSHPAGFIPEQESTPIIQQYSELKSKHADCILFFQLGDFYEFFGLDAVIASDLGQLTLTARDKHKPFPIPMAGIPLKALSSFAQTLMEHHLSLAIAEQVSEPGEEQIVRREITSIITPSLRDEEHLSQSEMGVFLASLVPHTKGTFSLVIYQNALNQIFWSETLPEHDVIYFLNHYRPAEILAPRTHKDLLMRTWALQLDFIPRWLEIAEEGVGGWSDLPSTFKHQIAERHTPALLKNIEAITSYLKRCYPQSERFEWRSHYLNPQYHLKIDDKTLKHLEIFNNQQGNQEGCLIQLLQKCHTKVGKQRLHENLRFPSQDLISLQYRQKRIAQAAEDQEQLYKWRETLRLCQGFNVILARLQRSRLKPQDLFSLCDQYWAFTQIWETLKTQQWDEPQSLEIENRIRILHPLFEEIENHLNRDKGPFEQDWLRPEQSEIYAEIQKNEKYIWSEIEKLWEQIKQNSGVEQIKLIQNKQLDLCFEITQSKASRLPRSVQIVRSLLSRLRFTTPELRQYEFLLKQNALDTERIYSQTLERFQKKLQTVFHHLELFDQIIAEWDVIWTGALWLHEPGWSLPVLEREPILELHNFFHPIIQHTKGGNCQKNSISLRPPQSVMLLTGPNMAGKSTLMRQVGVIQILAQIGFPVPAEHARIGLADQILTRLGSGDDSYRGLSTFMVEMLETVRILEHSTERSLVLMDELGRGTSTKDGEAIAQAVLEELCALQIRTLFSTHYHHLQELLSLPMKVMQMEVDIKDQENTGYLTFTYRLKEGGCQDSYGLYVAKLSGLPDHIYQRALQLKEKEHISLKGGQTESPRGCHPLEKLKNCHPESLTLEEARQLLKDLQDLTVTFSRKDSPSFFVLPS